jgi:predicted transposase/invertase (TIGR01784 family)
LIRQCYSYGYSRAYIRHVMNFSAMVIRLPVAFKKRIKDVIKKAEEDYKMEYVPLWERDARKAGVIEGKRVGKKEGFEEGIEKTAKNLLKMGLDVEKVSEATGLKKEDIEKLMETPQVH